MQIELQATDVATALTNEAERRWCTIGAMREPVTRG